MFKTIIVGLNSNLLNIIDSINGQIVVIDEASLKSKGHYVGFESEKVLALYQASLIAGQLEHNDFKASEEFYEHISNQQHELDYMNHKALVEILESKNIQILKGRLNVISPVKAELTYLGETTELEYSQLIINAPKTEENPYQSPFVFTFDQFLHTSQLFRRVLIDAQSLRGLEIASMMARFGSEVTLVVGRRLFAQIDHLMFRDAVRETLISQNIELLEKYTVETIEDLDASTKVTIKPMSQLAFEITEPVSEKTIEVDAVIVEGNIESPHFSESEIDKSVQDRVTNSIFLNPILSVVESDSVTERYQYDVQLFTYFRSRFEIEGGIEFLVDNNKIVGGTFYCYNALELAQLLKVINNDLNELKTLEVFDNSLLGVFKEAAHMILENGGEHEREEISSFN